MENTAEQQYFANLRATILQSRSTGYEIIDPQWADDHDRAYVTNGIKRGHLTLALLPKAKNVQAQGHIPLTVNNTSITIPLPPQPQYESYDWLITPTASGIEASNIDTFTNKL